jgi:hypothetical protein
MMRSALHISQARKMLDSGQKVDLYVVKKNGTILEAKEVVSLRYDFYAGTRTIKFLRSGKKRTIRDCLIIGINDFDVYL